MKVVVVANCQVQPIAKSLASICGVDQVIAIPIHLHGTKHFDLPAKEFYEITQADDCVILTFQNSARFGDFSSDSLQAIHHKVFTITNIHFTGIHPDITYIGDRGGRLQSPIGDYHSKLVLHSYLTGRSVKQCLERFQGKEYEAVGYFDEYKKSAMELINRDQGNSIQFSKCFLEIIKEHPSLYTINHPTGFVFQEYTNLIAEKLGLNFVKFPHVMLPNYLANSAWWPVFDELAETHGLKYKSPMVFKQPDALGGKLIVLEEFVHASYKLYDKQSDRLRNARQALEILERWGSAA